MRHAKLYAPAVLLVLCALWIGLIGAGRVCVTAWLVVLIAAAGISMRESWRHFRE